MRTLAGFLRLFAGRQARQGRPGERLARSLERLGPVAIKLGQVLSTRADIVIERARGDLVGERLEQVEVAPVDERHLDFSAPLARCRPFEGLERAESRGAKAGADVQDAKRATVGAAAHNFSAVEDPLPFARLGAHAELVGEMILALLHELLVGEDARQVVGMDARQKIRDGGGHCIVGKAEHRSDFWANIEEACR